MRHLRHPRRVLPFAGLLALAALVLLPSCKQLQQFANLRQVDFRIDTVRNAELAGVNLDRIRAPEDARPQDILRLTSAIAGRRAPLSFTLMLGAENPSDNDVSARLVQMDWTLLLDDRETISGTFDQNILLQPGQPQEIPIQMQLDLFEFFDRSARDVVDLALAVAGEGGGKNVKLRARPTIDTPIGPIQYPQAVTIVSQDVGGDAAAR